MRTAIIGGYRFVATPFNGDIVRIHEGEDHRYIRMIGVEREGGVLSLSGWMGNPRGLPWREAAAVLYPDDHAAVFKRLRADGSFDRKEVRL